MWELLQHEEFTDPTIHLNGHGTVVKKLRSTPGTISTFCYYPAKRHPKKDLERDRETSMGEAPVMVVIILKKHTPVMLL